MKKYENLVIRKGATEQLKYVKKVRKELETSRNALNVFDEECLSMTKDLEGIPAYYEVLMDLKQHRNSIAFFFCGKKERNRILNSIKSYENMLATMPSWEDVRSKQNMMLQLAQEIGQKESYLERFEDIDNSFDFKEIIDIIGYNTWYNNGPSRLSLNVGDKVLEFKGDVIEPSYEDFTAVVNIYLDGECIFGEGSRCAGAYRKERTSFGKFEKLDEAICYLTNTLHGLTVETFEI